MLVFIILGSIDIGREVTPRGFILDLVEKLKVCEVIEPRGIVLALEDLCCPFESCFHTHSVPQDHIHCQAYVLPKPKESMIAENGLGAELLSGCGVVSACNKNGRLVLCGCSTCLISSSWAPWTLVDK